MLKTSFTTLFFSVLALVNCAKADIKWPEYNQQCRDDAGTPFLDDDEIYGKNGFYHDKSGAYPELKDGKCAKPLEQACKDRPTIKTAYLEGPIDCGDKGWYCRIMPDPNWKPKNLSSDLNFGHCNTTRAFNDDGYDQDGHCHGSSYDNTYYWWVRDHFFRQYNGRLRCCCGWKEDTSTNPMYARRVANGCDYRRLVTKSEDITKCRDANEDHGMGFDIGCDPAVRNSQLNKPIPEDDDICWEVQRFGYTSKEFDIPTAAPTPFTAPTPIAPTTKAPTTEAPIPAPTSAPSPTDPSPTSPTTKTPTTTTKTPTTTTKTPTTTTKTPTTTTKTPTTTTKTPTTTTKTPTKEPESCEDSVVEFKLGNKWRDCEWAAENKSRCTKGNKSKLVRQTCPDTCGTCDKCVDSAAKLKIEIDEDKWVKKKCNWAKKNTKKKCGYAGVSEACRDTCGLCDDEEEKDYFDDADEEEDGEENIFE